MPIVINGSGSVTGITTRLAAAAAPAGSVIQTVSSVKTDTTTSSIQAGTNWTGHGLEVDITPSSASNKILITGQVSVNYNYDEFVHLTLYKNGSALTTATGDADGSTSRITAACDVDFNWGTSPLPFHFLDTAGATSEQTYTFALSSGGDSAVTVYLNRGYHATDASWNSRTISTITAREIAV